MCGHPGSEMVLGDCRMCIWKERRKCPHDDSFHGRYRNKSSTYLKCLLCVREYRRQRTEAIVDGTWSPDKAIASKTELSIVDGKLQCSKCFEWKEVEEHFSRSSKEKNKTGYKSRCKACCAGDLRQGRYGVSDDNYWTLCEVQDFICPLCLERKELVLDHSHDSGVVRGLICNRCNTVLHEVEDVEWLQRALQYLKTPPLAVLNLGKKEHWSTKNPRGHKNRER